MEIQCENMNIFIWGLSGVNKVYFFGPKNYNNTWDESAAVNFFKNVKILFPKSHKVQNE